MKVLIEKYRGFDVEFDTDYNRFSSIITDGLEKESKSFPAVRKYIDDYLKENQPFSPFWIVRRIPTEGNKVRQQVVGIRKDGRFIVEKDGKQEQLSDYYLDEYVLEDSIDEKAYSEYIALEKEHLELRNAYFSKKGELREKLKGMSLTEFKEQVLASNS